MDSKNVVQNKLFEQTASKSSSSHFWNFCRTSKQQRSPKHICVRFFQFIFHVLFHIAAEYTHYLLLVTAIVVSGVWVRAYQKHHDFYDFDDVSDMDSEGKFITPDHYCPLKEKDCYTTELNCPEKIRECSIENYNVIRAWNNAIISTLIAGLITYVLNWLNTMGDEAMHFLNNWIGEFDNVPTKKQKVDIDDNPNKSKPIDLEEAVNRKMKRKKRRGGVYFD